MNITNRLLSILKKYQFDIINIMSTCVFQYHIFINKKINMILQYVLFNFKNYFTILHDRSKHILKSMYFGINDTCLHEEYIYK